MSRKDETVASLKAGLPPSQICRLMGVSVHTTIGYLHQKIGCGELRRSDVFYAIPREVREVLNRVCIPGRSTTPNAIWSRIQRRQLHHVWDEPYYALDDIVTYLEFREARFAYQDLYDDLRRVECGWHEFVKKVLQREIGPGRSEWWSQGIPVEVRKECASRREEDEDGARVEAYRYTDTIHLVKIMEASWKYFEPHIPQAKKNSRFKKDLMDQLKRMNVVRRKVMHPVRGIQPTEDDFELLRSLRGEVDRLMADLDVS